MMLCIGECEYILKVGFCCNWSVRCVVCVCCNFVLDRLRSGFVVVLRCCCGSKICYSGVCKCVDYC